MHEPGEISEWLVVIGLAVSVLVSSPVVGGGVEIEGVTFADTFQAGPLPMPRQGEGVAKSGLCSSPRGRNLSACWMMCRSVWSCLTSEPSRPGTSGGRQ